MPSRRHPEGDGQLHGGGHLRPHALLAQPRWERKKDLRVMFPDLTEDEALMLRAMHEGDESYES